MRKGIWAGPKVKRDPVRVQGPRDPTPIILTGLWHELSAPQQRRLAELGFDQPGWDNNVRERVQTRGDDLWVGDLCDGPRRHEVMVDDRARRTEAHVALYESGC